MPTEVVRAAIAGACGSGQACAAPSWIPGRILGVDAWLLLDLDEAEHRRRRERGLGSVISREFLRLLSDLPHGEAVRVVDLTSPERRCLGRLPCGVVDAAGGWVTRLALPPVTIDLAIVTGNDPDRGLDSASRFAPFARRLLVLTRPPRDLPNVEAEARFYGIGLAIADEAEGVIVVHPEPLSTAIGPVTWRVSEEAYAAYLTAQARRHKQYSALSGV